MAKQEQSRIFGMAKLVAVHQSGDAMTARRTSRRRTERRRNRVAVAAAGVVAVATIALAVTRLAGNDNPEPSGGADGFGVAHVHGLGVNPADGSLIVATHYGAFRIPPDADEAVRIGDSYQDTMGFTVAGPDHFLGSGHPDVPSMQAGQPTRLGLIESTDGGETWTAISLSGEVDFHGLVFAHDQLYGWDSGTGRFMVSDDRRRWESRSTVGLSGLAVDPDDANHIVGSGAGGILESRDGGRTWAATDGPAAVAVSWNPDAGLWATDQSGAVWRHDATGWQRAGELSGEPQAFLAAADALYAAVHDDQDITGIYRSTDDGRTWQLRYRDAQE